MAIARQLTVMMENRPGALAALCSELAARAVNIHAINASPARPLGAVQLLLSPLETGKQICDRLGHKYVEEDVIAVKVGDRPGALGKVTRKLAEKGINIEYAYGSIARGATQALIVLGVSDVAGAARLVK